MERRLSNSKLISLFLISISLIAYELYVMRVFSIGSWSNFGSLIISTALLGVGLSGTLLTFLLPKIKSDPAKWLFNTALIFLPATAFAHVLSQLIPLNPLAIGSDPSQLLLIGAYYLIYGIPFFFGALFIGISFIYLSGRIYQVYFWNMLGSGVGGLIIVLLMYLIAPVNLIYPIIFLIIIGVLMVGLEEINMVLSISKLRLIQIGLVSVLSLVLLMIWGDIRVSEYKSISYIENFPDSKIEFKAFSPTGEYTIYSSSALHFAPGLSDNAALELDSIPENLYWGLYIDGNGPIGIMGEMSDSDKAYMDYLPMAAPFSVLGEPDVLLVNSGGGINAQVASYKNSRSITLVEPNSDLISILKNDPHVVNFTGNLLNQNNIDVVIEDPRAYASSNPEQYDLVEISLIDSIGLSSSGGYAVHENFTYTVEAIEEYMSALRPEGLLSLTVWNRLHPPRNVPRLLSTIVTALKDMGIVDPSQHIIMFDYLRATGTILVKKTPFSQGEIYDLERFVRLRSFNIIHTPNMDFDGYTLSQTIDYYRSPFEGTESTEDLNINATDFYRTVLHELFADNDQALYDEYIFDIRPMTDSRPYYSGYLKMNEMGLYLDQIQDVSEEWGYLLVIGVVIQSIIFGLIVILIPVFGKWKALFSERKGTVGSILYFSSLGLGYMLVEIFLIQRLSVYLSDPTFSVSIVITAMLIMSALGNLTSGLLRKHRKYVVLGASLIITLSLLFYIFGLDSVLNSTRTASFFARIIISILVIFPAAFFMGIPFPNGLGAVDANRPALLPWAWGMNGGLSVTGAALARLISVSAGFPWLLALAAFLYFLVGIVYPSNEGSSWFAMIKALRSKNTDQSSETKLVTETDS